MEIKHINKLRELDGFNWEGNMLRSIYVKDEYGTELNLKRKIKYIDGSFKTVILFEVSEKNLSELEFYGLKVVLNEKPKLTKKERGFLECHGDNFFIARSKDNSLSIFEIMPEQCLSRYWGRSFRDDRLVINNNLFKFITWESGKAWSKSELMELEVVE